MKYDLMSRLCKAMISKPVDTYITETFPAMMICAYAIAAYRSDRLRARVERKISFIGTEQNA